MTADNIVPAVANATELDVLRARVAELEKQRDALLDSITLRGPIGGTR